MKALLLTLALFVVPAQTEPATVYVYMPEHASTLGRFSGKVYVDDKATAEINKKRFLVLRLPSGSHSFYVKNKKFGGLTLELLPSTTYYLRVNVDDGGYFMRFRGLSSIPKEEAEFTIKQLQPIRLKDVLDKTKVDLNVTSK